MEALKETLFSRPLDYIICCNKVLDDWFTVCKNLKPLVEESTTIVSAQNGMNVESPLLEAFPNNTVLAVLCNINCAQIRPGFVEQTAGINAAPFFIGITRESAQGVQADSARRDSLAAMDPGFKIIECVLKERWKKLVFNNAWNSTTTIFGLDTHQLLQIPSAIEIVLELAREAVNVARESGIEIDKDFPSQVVELARNTLPIIPSTLQDILKKRRMELCPVFG